jgi:hypothetical protein
LGTNGAEMAEVDGQDASYFEAFGGGDYGGGGESKVEIAILFEEFAGAGGVLGGEWLDGEDACDDVIQEIQFRADAEFGPKKIVDFAEDGRGDHDIVVLLDDELSERAVMAVVTIVEAVDGARVGNQRHLPRLAAARRISRARSETLVSPLAYLPSPFGRDRL